MRSRSAQRLALLLTLLIAFALRTYRLDYQELRGDEVFGYFFSLRSIPEILHDTLELAEPHPIASYYLQKTWLIAVGHSEFALRFVSLWFGVLAVALLFRLARRLSFSCAAALLAPLLLAVSPYAIWHSQDARMYSISLALTTASTWLALEWLVRRRWPWATAYVGVSLLALHTHYFAAFVLLAQSIYVVGRAAVAPAERRRLVSLVGLQGVIGLLYLPWLLLAGRILRDYIGNGDSPTFDDMLRRAWGVLAVGESTPADPQIWWGLLAALLLIWGGVRLFRSGERGHDALWLLAVYLALPLLATWWSAQQRPIFNERYLIAAAPPFYLLIGAVLQPVPGERQTTAGMWLRRLAPLGLTLLLVAGAAASLNRAYVDPVYSKTRGWRELADALSQFAGGPPADAVRIAQNFPDPTIWYYYDGPVEHVVLPPAPGDEAGAGVQVEKLANAGVTRVILPVQPAPNWDATGIAQAVLSERYDRVIETQVGVWPLEVYALPPREEETLGVRFANGVMLESVSISPDEVRPDGALIVHLDWLVEREALAGTEKVFMHLLGPGGQVVAQQDRPLDITRLTEIGPTAYGILLPDRLPAGEYNLVVGLYDPAQEGAPRILTEDDDDSIILRIFDVE